MPAAITLSPKQIWLMLQAIDASLADAKESDAANDFGNDLWNLKLLGEELTALQSPLSGQSTGAGTAIDYQCWFDPEDNCLSLLRYQDVKASRDNGQLSGAATLQYAFIAHTGEEAMAVHCLRQGWAPYLPVGEAVPCPNCGANYYPECYGDCWRCGHIG